MYIRLLKSAYVISATGGLSNKGKTKNRSTVGSWGLSSLLMNICHATKWNVMLLKQTGDIAASPGLQNDPVE